MNVDIDGLNINYVDMGEGYPIIFLHGWGACIQSWGIVLSALSKSFRVIAPDFPGHGATPEPDRVFTVDDFTELTIKFMEKLNLEKANIVCHSFGGRVSIKLANKRPDLINKMVFTDAAGVLPRRGWKYYYKIYKYKIGKRLYNCNPARRSLKAIGIDLEDRIKNAGSSDYKQLSDNMKKTFINVVNEDLTPLLKNIKCSTLLIWGDADTDTPMYMAKTMEREIKDSGLVVFEGSGHFSYLDNIPRYVKIIEVFFGG